MNINAITPNLYQRQNQNYNSTSFKGLLTNKYPKILSKASMASMMRVSEEDINDMTRHASKKKKYFLQLLVNRYSTVNFCKPLIKQDSVESVINIYNNIGRVKDSHIDMIDNLPFSITILEDIFSLTKNRNSYNNFVQKVDKDLQRYRDKSIGQNALSHEEELNQRGNIIVELLESKNIKEYIKHYSKYSPFIKSNANNRNLAALLDKMVESGEYDYNLEKEKRFVEHLKATYSYPETENFNFEMFRDNYSRKGEELINVLLFFMETDNNFFKKHDKSFRDIFVSTNAENYKLRYKLIKSFISSIKSEKDDSLEKLNELTKRIDADKETEKFVKRILSDSINISLSMLLSIIEANSSKMLNIFYPNIKKICTELSGRNIVSCINTELTKPFYTTKHYRQEKERIYDAGFSTNRVSNYIETTIGNIRWNLSRAFDFLTSTQNNNKKVLVDTSMPAQAAEPIRVNIQPQQKTVPVFVQTDLSRNSVPVANSTVIPPSYVEPVPVNTVNNDSIKPEIKPIIEDVKPAEEVKLVATEVKPAEAVKPKPKRKNLFEIKLKPLTPAQIENTNNTINYIKTKLGPKVFLDQKHDYSVVTTKMRLQMLPEIFDSIADTRKRDRAAGIAKLNVSNKDAYLLFSKIDGANRKLVNYLLKKRNVDGTRIFDIKEIVSILEKAEQEISLAKAANPGYKSKDRKDYYSSLLREKVQEYGKVKYQRKKKIDIKNA